MRFFISSNLVVLVLGPSQVLLCQTMKFGPFQVTQFVNGLFESRNDLSTFKDHIRDFLVQSKEFSAQVSSSSFKLYHLYVVSSISLFYSSL